MTVCMGNSSPAQQTIPRTNYHQHNFLTSQACFTPLSALREREAGSLRREVSFCGDNKLFPIQSAFLFCSFIFTGYLTFCQEPTKYTVYQYYSTFIFTLVVWAIVTP